MNEMPRKKRGICFFEMQSKSQILLEMFCIISNIYLLKLLYI